MTDLRGPDPNVRAAVEHLVETDPAVQAHVKRLLISSIKTLYHYMEHGTPDQRLAISTKFVPLMVKALSGSDGEKQTNDLLQEVRDAIGGVIPEDLKGA